jgi:hypothetical protein
MRKTAAAAAIDATEAELATANDPDAMRNAFAALMEKGFPSPKKSERKARERKVAKMVDGRTLRAKGRTAQFNVKVKPELKQALSAWLEKDGISLADWLERTIEREIQGN